jgi:ubiquinone/menaquinone biosynthesis C-methylase UbiE
VSESLKDAIETFDTAYVERGMRSQRSYPNEALIQFLASRYFRLPLEERGQIRILEVGAGSGANLWMIAKEGFDTYGIDSSQAGLDLAKHHLQTKWNVSATLVTASFTSLPFDDNFFDAVVDVVSLQHLCLADTPAAFREIHRTLKRDGTFFSYRLSDHSIMFAQTDEERIDAATLKNISNPAMPLANNGPISFWSPALAHDYYKRAGFKMESIERIGRTYPNAHFVEYLALAAVKV